MADTDPKSRQERKSKGKYSTKDKERYNAKHVRSYENRMANVTCNVVSTISHKK